MLLTTDGTTTMDLRFAAFELVSRDAALRALLVNHADRIDDGGDGRGPRACYLALHWADDDRPDAPPGSQLLVARAHLPADRPWEHPYLDFVLARLRTALTGDAARGSISARRLDTGPRDVERGVDTIYKTSTFEITAAAPRLRSRTVLEQPPSGGTAGPGPACTIAPTGAAPSAN